jgi:hypothetical protein
MLGPLAQTPQAAPVAQPSALGPEDPGPVGDLEMKQILRARGYGQYVDRMIHRIDRVDSRFVGIKWGIVEGSSSNWGGYIADVNGTGNFVSQTQGFFNVTQVTSTPAVSSWTGVGGVYGTKKLWQTGIDQYALQAWIEFFPDSALYFFPVHVGDQIFSNVFYTQSNNTWTLVISDQTGGDYTSRSRANDSPDISTGEWITEAQPGTTVPFFVHVNFSGSYWWRNTDGFAQAIDSSLARQTIHTVLKRPATNPAYCVYPDSLVLSGTSFNNWWGC